jgi:acyl-CoA hydrolase
MRALAALAVTGCITALHVTTPATVTVGATAPPFALPAQNGHVVSLAGELAHGPVAIVFYRGYW